MIDRFKVLAYRHKGIISNFSNLSLLQLFNIVLPLIVYPYLISVLGASIYGEIIFAQTVCTYFVILINFGLNVSSTKDVSIHRDNKNKLSEIVSTVYFIKIITWLISFIILCGLVLFVPYIGENKWLFFFSFLFCFQELLFPQWFFQGVEKMGYITFTNLITRSILIIFIFLFVKSKEDFLLVPFFYGLGSFLGGIIGIYLLFSRENISLIIPKKEMIKRMLKDGGVLFLSDVVISIKDKLNIIFIGVFLGMHQIAIYDLAIKIMSLLNQPIGIINNAIYPKVAKEKNMPFVKKIIKYTTIAVIFLVIFVQLILPSVIESFVPILLDGLLSVRLLLIAPIFFVTSVCLARNVYIVLGKYKLLLTGMVLTTCFYLLCIGIGYLFNLLHFIESFVVITVLVYLFEVVYRVFALRFIK